MKFVGVVIDCPFVESVTGFRMAELAIETEKMILEEQPGSPTAAEADCHVAGLGSHECRVIGCAAADDQS